MTQPLLYRSPENEPVNHIPVDYKPTHRFGNILYAIYEDHVWVKGDRYGAKWQLSAYGHDINTFKLDIESGRIHRIKEDENHAL